MTTTNDSVITLKKKEIICEVCHKIFKRRKDLKSHFIVHLDKKPFCCTICSEAFKHKVSLKRHLLIHSGEKPFVCQVCDKSFRQKGSLNEHALTHTGEKPHSCEICKLGFTTKSNYVRHLRKHMTSKSFICIICGKGFNVRSYLTQHYEKVHKETNAADVSQFNESLSIANDDKHTRNKISDVFVVNVGITNESQNSVLQKQCNPCKICCTSQMKSLTKKTNSCKHQLCQSQDRFTCTYCGDSFTQNENLQKHLKLHPQENTNQKICSKEINLENKQYFNKKGHQKHYICSDCNKSYKREIEYIQHSLIHKIPGPFECDICVDGIQFENLCELHRHYTEHDDNVCSCYFCRDSFGKDINGVYLDMQFKSNFHKCNVCHMSFNDLIFLKKHSSYHIKHKPHVIKLKI